MPISATRPTFNPSLVRRAATGAAVALSLSLGLAACSDRDLSGATPDEAFEVVQQALCETNERCATADAPYDEAACLASFDDKANFQEVISEEDLTQLEVCLDALDAASCDAAPDIETATECVAVKQYLDLK